MSLKTFVLLVSLVGLARCASTPQVDRLLKDPAPLALKARIQNVPFVSQSENQCGPASLSMVAKFAGRDLTPEYLGTMMITPAKRGTLPLDFLGAARRTAFLAVPVYGLKNLLAEVGAGHPVVVLQNLGSTANPIWHYAVVIGYDLSTKKIFMHSGTTANQEMALTAFEPTWSSRAPSWAAVVLDPSQMPQTSSLNEVLPAASALERAGELLAAKEAYGRILRQYPESIVALFGLGNVESSMGNFRASIRAYERAAKFQPTSKSIQNNLAEARRKLLGKKMRR